MWLAELVDVVIIRSARRVDNLDQLAMGVKHAVACTLVLASFRRLLWQEAFLHQKCSDPKDFLWCHFMEPPLHILNWVSSFPQEHGRWGAVASVRG